MSFNLSFKGIFYFYKLSVRLSSPDSRPPKVPMCRHVHHHRVLWVGRRRGRKVSYGDLDDQSWTSKSPRGPCDTNLSVYMCVHTCAYCWYCPRVYVGTHMYVYTSTVLYTHVSLGDTCVYIFSICISVTHFHISFVFDLRSGKERERHGTT